MRKVRDRLTYANVMSSIAVFMVLGGSAYAAATLPKNSVGSKQIRSNAVSSSKVKNGSLLSKDFKAGQLKAGPQGAQGAKGDKGDQGGKGDQGDRGSDFTADTVLASGKTLTGQWGAFGTAGGYVGDAQTYRLPLGATPATNSAHYITGSAFTSACPAVGQAARGQLCVYEYGSAATAFQGIYGIDSTGLHNGRGSKDGFEVTFTGGGSGFVYAEGSYAMTAP